MKPEVYTIMGLGGKLKPGVPFIDRLLGSGESMRNLAFILNAELYQYHAEEIILQAIINKDIYKPAPIVIIGHSLGGSTAARVATRLDKLGIVVSYLALLDTHGSPETPESTLLVDSIVPVKPLCVKFNREKRIVIQGATHFNIPDRPQVLNLITNRINSVKNLL